MNDVQPIRGKVARILNTRELVINLGAEQDIKRGMRFDVLDQKDEDIKDPDTGDVLGSIERPKVRVEVVKVFDRMCVASTYKKTRVNVGGSGVGMGGLASVLMPAKWVTKYETLKTDERTLEDLSEQESYVKIGDTVVQVIDSTDED